MRSRAQFSLLLSVALSVCLLIAPAQADVRLPHIIASNMVLQRDMPVPVWGWAEPGEKVIVRLAGNEAAATADAQGRWSVKLPAMKAGGPETMEVVGKNALKLENILIGEVWICSGQSNMEMGINSVNYAEKEVAAANYPSIRLFQLSWKTAAEPQTDVNAAWRSCTPDNMRTGGFWGAGFPAAAYFFGREIHKELNVPVGLVATAWGGTRIEPWTPRAGFEMVPALQNLLQVIDEATPKFNKAVVEAVAATRAWLPTAEKAVQEHKPVPPPPAWPKHLLENNSQPTSIYNGMVHPLVPFAIRGAIWYQGESNHPDGMAYFDKMKALIGGWRKVWGQGAFPFYYVQIAPLAVIYPPDVLPKLWEAQTAALSIPNTGMIVTTDIGDLKDIHPKNKQDVGKRLALWALAKTYGRKDIVFSGPLYKAMAVEGDKIRLTFHYAENGLASRDGKPLSWFQIAGEDKKFVEAEATIDGDTVVVRSDAVKKPVAVRFGWHNAAEPNLMNQAGLPASPFRTDQW